MERQAWNNINEFATNTIKAAGQLILDDFGRVAADPKGRFDLVTATDLAVEKFLQQEIQRNFPEHDIIAEESIQAGKISLDTFCWVIDPLDGTVNFALGIPFFSISLALLQSGEPILGWVYDPIRQELFRAAQGKGSFANEQPLTINTDRSLPLPVGGSSDFIDWSVRAGRSALLSDLLGDFGKLRVMGSQALHLCYVAAGRLRAAISWEAKLWDDAAGALIAQEAGASYTDFWGQPVFPVAAGSPLLSGGAIHSVAASPGTHARLLIMLAQVGDDLS